MSISETLEQLNENSFAIWLMDDGTLYVKNYPKYTPYYTLSIKRFSKEEALLTKHIIKRKFGIELTVNDMHKDYYNNGKKYKVNNIYFPTSETFKIIDILTSCNFGEDLKRTMANKLMLQ
ncbi:LAGLIDADG DNA endonuclease family protein [compost metagenome]